MARRISQKPDFLEIKTKLRNLGLTFDTLILFGSHAKGLATEHSDVDLCLVYTDRVKDIKKQQLKASIYLNYNEFSADVVVTTKSQLKKDRLSPILHEIRTTGVEI